MALSGYLSTGTSLVISIGSGRSQPAVDGGMKRMIWIFLGAYVGISESILKDISDLQHSRQQ